MNLSPNLVQPSYYYIPPVSVGEHTYFSECCHMAQFTEVGKFCSIGNLCTLGAQPHPVNELTTFPQKLLFPEREVHPARTVIGNDVWIGSNSIVMGGLTVGNGAVIGAGSVVTTDVPAYAIVAGNPARLLRYRFSPSVIEWLQMTKWWDLPLDSIRPLPFKDINKCIAMLAALRGLEFSEAA